MDKGTSSLQGDSMVSEEVLPQRQSIFCFHSQICHLESVVPCGKILKVFKRSQMEFLLE